MTAPALTADLIARGIIAAAGFYGDDPITACTCHQKATARRSLTATAGALNLAGVAWEPIERVLGLKRASVYANRAHKPELFVPAQRAALGAMQIARSETAAAVAPPQPETRGTLRFKIIEVLREAPSSSPSLAILTDANELAVLQTITALVREGIVSGGPIPPAGARARQWSLVKAVAA